MHIQDNNKDAIRNAGAIPDILAVLNTAQSDRLKAILVATFQNLLRCGMGITHEGPKSPGAS